MKPALCLVLLVIVNVGMAADGNVAEQEVKASVLAFYDAFSSHDFSKAPEFTTDDWVHINPLGGVTRGRDAVLKELKEVHATFLKGVTDKPEEMSVKLASADVAIATVVSRVSTFTTPDGVKHGNEQHVRTFVLVRREGKWLIMQDQNTIRSR